MVVGESILASDMRFGRCLWLCPGMARRMPATPAMGLVYELLGQGTGVPA